MTTGPGRLQRRVVEVVEFAAHLMPVDAGAHDAKED